MTARACRVLRIDAKPTVAVAGAVVIIGLATLLVPAPARAAGLAYLRTSSQLQVGTDAGRLHPLNLLDGDPETFWCAAVNDTNDSGPVIQIVFKSRQRIDRITLAPARVGRSVTSVRISDGKRAIEIALGNEPVTEALPRPLDGTEFEITMPVGKSAAAESGAPTGAAAAGAGAAGAGGAGGGGKGAIAVPAQATCLADVLLFTKSGVFGTSSRKSTLKYEEQLARLLGTWSGGALGAPDRKLVFMLDGSWDWELTPLLEGAPKKAHGEYRFRGNRLLMRMGEAGRWTEMNLKVSRVKVDPGEMGAPRGDYDQLKIGTGLGADLGGEYNNAVFE